jgi:DNA polymerase (family 10)
VAISNAEIAAILNRLADWAEVAGEDLFRVRAYRNAARTVEGMSQSVADLAAEGQDLSKFRWIGKSIARKLDEIVKTGRLKQLEQLEQRMPGDLTEILSLPSLGPKRVRTLYDDLAITTLAQLEQAAREHKIRKLFGLGPRTEERILEELTRRKGAEGRVRLDVAEEVASSLVAYLRAIQGVREVVVAGSFRRRRETLGDLDLLVTCRPRSSVMEQVLRYPAVEEVHASGPTRSAVRLRGGLNVDVRVVPEEAFGAALHYFTGSKTHNIAVRRRGIARGLKINEYGVFQGKQRVAGRTEEEVFAAVDLPYIEPELREGRGEIEAARDGWLPDLITVDSIRGDLHCHTLATDGQASIEQLAEVAQDMGYEYLAITDPSKSPARAYGLDENQVAEQLREIDRLNGRLRRFRILKGIEVEILEDGSLALDEAILTDLDVRICAIHSHLDLPKSQQTERIIRAMDNPHFTILAHPTGRRIGEREPYPVDMERVMRAARQRGCILEVNASPQRLDLSDVHIRMAKDLGVKLAISTDARRTSDFASLRYGVDQARRGWAEAADVVNTRPLQELRGLLQHTPRPRKPKPR